MKKTLLPALLLIGGSLAGTAAVKHHFLALDESWVQSRSGLQATLHQPEKSKSNPIIQSEFPWEPNPYCFGTVLYDRQQQVFKMWYQSYAYSGFPNKKLKGVVLYATSQDGVKWVKPELGIHDYKGSSNNNIVLPGYGYGVLYSPSVVKDLNAPDPSRRYKMIFWDFAKPHPKAYQGSEGMCVAFSPDGLNWEKYDPNPVLIAKKSEDSVSDVMSVMYDQTSRKFVAYTKGWADPFPHNRQIVRTESEDFLQWSTPEPVIRHAYDLQDPQSYGMSVTQYHGLYIGLLQSYKKPGNSTIDLQLTYSTDNKTWRRPCEQATFLPLGQAGDWDSGMLFSTPMLAHGNQLMFFYGAWDGHHETKKRRAAIGLATLRKDGFVSLDAAEAIGSVTTQAFAISGGERVVINAENSGGHISVEILDARGQPIPGYSRGKSKMKPLDEIHQLVTWGQQERLTVPAQAIKLRITLQRAQLYSIFVIDPAN